LRIARCTLQRVFLLPIQTVFQVMEKRMGIELDEAGAVVAPTDGKFIAGDEIGAVTAIVRRKQISLARAFVNAQLHCTLAA
jgi:hypothetical protein